MRTRFGDGSAHSQTAALCGELHRSTEMQFLAGLRNLEADVSPIGGGATALSDSRGGHTVSGRLFAAIQPLFALCSPHSFFFMLSIPFAPLALG
ncbi:MAG: hypothetical protein ACOC05_11005 [Oceanicaulis sp.]